MICQLCKQRTATTHLKQIINGKTTQMVVCDHCASKHGVGLLNLSPMSVGNLFGGFFTEPVWHETDRVDRCATCSKTFRDIVNEGRVGCSDCYTTFYDRLLPSVQRIHGKTTHVGKSIVTVERIEPTETVNELEVLKNDLQQAIDAQEYERCVALRDRIKQLEGEGRHD